MSNKLSEDDFYEYCQKGKIIGATQLSELDSSCFDLLQRLVNEWQPDFQDELIEYWKRKVRGKGRG